MWFFIILGIMYIININSKLDELNNRLIDIETKDVKDYNDEWI